MGEENKESRKVYWLGEVRENNYKEIVEKVIYFYEEDPQQEITLYVTSQGGDATLALAFYDLIRLLEIPLKTIGFGKVSSAGIIILLAGRERLASSNCIFMMHPFEHCPSGGRHFSYSRKDLPWMKNRVEVVDNKIRSIITSKTRMNQNQISEFIESQKYFTADEAQQKGLIDEIILSWG